jgi:hypothetical protein
MAVGKAEFSTQCKGEARRMSSILTRCDVGLEEVFVGLGKG